MSRRIIINDGDNDRENDIVVSAEAIATAPDFALERILEKNNNTFIYIYTYIINYI